MNGPLRLARASVLVVEDEPALQRAVCRELERRGFAARAAFDCGGALELLEEAFPDVVYVDLCLPDQSGYELCETLRRIPGRGDVPILVAAEAAFPEQMVHAERAGANALIEKPFRLEELVSCLEALLDRAPMSTAFSHILRLP